MRITICAVGKLKKNAPEDELFAKYVKRLKWQIDVKEVVVSQNLPVESLIVSEGEKLLKAVPKGSFIVALDERGEAFSSIDFANELQKTMTNGISDVAFLIGGADGHSREVLTKADLILSLGKMVWPHFLVRAMLIEQIYRAKTIIEGHPYHRE